MAERAQGATRPRMSKVHTNDERYQSQRNWLDAGGDRPNRDDAGRDNDRQGDHDRDRDPSRDPREDWPDHPSHRPSKPSQRETSVRHPEPTNTRVQALPNDDIATAQWTQQRAAGRRAATAAAEYTSRDAELYQAYQARPPSDISLSTPRYTPNLSAEPLDLFDPRLSAYEDSNQGFRSSVNNRLSTTTQRRSNSNR